MMKPRSSRAISEQAMSSRNKTEPSTINNQAAQRNQAQLNTQQTNAQAIRKRRSSINVYDQPSSLNSRLRQLETDMLRLDEDRTKLFDDTHSALAQSELRLNEIHAILKSRQDNVEKYVEDMKLLLQAKEEFEKQAKLLNEKHDRIQDKFMHRETTISREIKLLKNKFELLEKNRQFRSILQKSNNLNSSDISEDLANGLDLGNNSERTGGGGTSDTNSELATGSMQANDRSYRTSGSQRTPGSRKNVRIKLSKFSTLKQFFVEPIIRPVKRRIKLKSNRVSSIISTQKDIEGGGESLSSTTIEQQANSESAMDGQQVEKEAADSSVEEKSSSKRKKKTKKKGLFGFFR